MVGGYLGATTAVYGPTEPYLEGQIWPWVATAAGCEAPATVQ
jgi:hypothetical protein